MAPESRPAPLPFLSIKKIAVHYRPRPVVGIIAPWNYPVANALMDAIGALAAGCAVLLKPSERTPLTAEVLLRGWLDSGAPEVLALAQGAREVSEAVIDNSDYIQFTGSTATGTKVAERAARRLTPGQPGTRRQGPDDRAARTPTSNSRPTPRSGARCSTRARPACRWSGCTCSSRSTTSSSPRSSRPCENLKMGAGEGHDFGALIDESQVAVTARHVDDALAKGARALTGGKRPEGAGSFYPATVLVDVDHSMACMTEETFGPTLPIMKVSSVGEAVRLANDSPYGLSASVFSKDIERAKDIALQLDCGAVNVNDVISNLMCTTAPMGGWKTSGIGARFGGDRRGAQVLPAGDGGRAAPDVGAGGTYYNNSLKALARVNKMMTKMALSRPKREAK